MAGFVPESPISKFSQCAIFKIARKRYLKLNHYDRGGSEDKYRVGARARAPRVPQNWNGPELCELWSAERLIRL